VENNETPREKEEPDNLAPKPPGQFVSTDLEQQTARFIEEVKGLAQRRRKLEAEERRGPPPQPGGTQRSRRR
jgi:hypothetical protein